MFYWDVKIQRLKLSIYLRLDNNHNVRFVWPNRVRETLHRCVKFVRVVHAIYLIEIEHLPW